MLTFSFVQVNTFVTPKRETVEAVNKWLSENNVTATNITSAGNWLSIEVPVSKANELFDADFSTYKHINTGQNITRTLSYSIPADLSGHISVVHPTTRYVICLQLYQQSTY